MNQVILLGRLVKDPEIKVTQSQKPVCSFTLAVNRKFKSASGERQSDFLSCVAWNQQAEFLGKYFQKGSRLLLTGNIQSSSYDDANGKKVYLTEVIVDNIEFVDSKKDEQRQEHTPPAPPAVDSGFYPTMDDDTTLPFDL